MGFVKVNNPPKENCKCRWTKPVGAGKNFGIGTIWRCDICGSAFEFIKMRNGGQFDGDIPEWTRSPAYDGPDTRVVVIPKASHNYTQQHSQWGDH